MTSQENVASLLIEQASESIIMLDPDDSDALKALPQILKKIAGTLPGQEICQAAALASAQLLERLIAGQEPDKGPSLDLVGQAINILQQRVRDGRSSEEATFPPALNLDSLPVIAEPVAAPPPPPLAPPPPPPPEPLPEPITEPPKKPEVVAPPPPLPKLEPSPAEEPEVAAPPKPQPSRPPSANKETSKMTAIQEAQAEDTLTQLAGKYLTFKLAAEEFGLEILKVQEIIKMMDITRVPRTPSFVRGVINLRGKVIPVVDLRLKFEMDTVATTEKTCIIVVQVARREAVLTMGIIVDEVSEVLDIIEKEIEPAPSFGSDVDTHFILGMAKTKGSVKILLDINKVLAADEIASLSTL